MSWFHEICLGLTSKDDKNGLAVCNECRQIAARVGKIEQSNAAIKDSVNSVLELVTGLREYVSVEHELRVEAERRCEELQARLRQQPQTPTPEPATPDPPAKAPTPPKTLLIGDSVIRDVNPRALKDTTVISMKGAKVSDINKRLSEYSTQCDKIILSCGGNDISPDCDITVLINEYSTMLKNAKQMCGNISVSSILPREDINVQNKINDANKLLQITCGDVGCTYIDLNPVFMLSCGEINDGYFADSVHLTLKGSRKLVTLLELQTCAENTVDTKAAYAVHAAQTTKNTTLSSNSNPNDKPRLFNGPGDILSNLAPCPLKAQNMNFCSLEQLYNYRKARFCKADHLIPEIMATTDCWAIMKISKQIPVNERFETIKFDIMSDCLQTKLEQSQRYRDELLESGERRIIENTANKVWGRGDPSTYDGLNMLGQLHEIKRRSLISGKSSHTTVYKYCKTSKRGRQPPPPSADVPARGPPRKWLSANAPAPARQNMPMLPPVWRPAQHRETGLERGPPLAQPPPPPRAIHPSVPAWQYVPEHKARSVPAARHHNPAQIQTNNRYAPLALSEFPSLPHSNVNDESVYIANNSSHMYDDYNYYNDVAPHHNYDYHNDTAHHNMY